MRNLLLRFSERTPIIAGTQRFFLTMIKYITPTYYEKKN